MVDQIDPEAQNLINAQSIVLESKFRIVTDDMSYWINVIRVWMTVQVIIIHQSWRIQYDYGIRVFCETCQKKWWAILLPHLLTGYGTANVQIFFAFAGFFSQLSMEKLYSKYQHDTIGFLKEFAYYFVKRYFQMHAVLLIFGLGYAPFLYYLFGENGRDVYYFGPRTQRYWLDNFLPIYWKNRVVQSSSKISGAAWFSNSLTNVEFIFYCIYLFCYFIRKYVKLDIYYIIIKMIILTTSLTLITHLCFDFDMFFDSNLYYLAGLYLYYARHLLVNTRYGQQFLSWCHSQSSKGTLCRYIFSVLMLYSWVVVSRINYDASIQFMLLPILLDVIPFPRFTFFSTFIKEMNRLAMPIYILHHPFILEAAPQYFPQILPDNLNGLNSLTSSWFIAWLLPLQFAMLSYPLWFMTKPVENLPKFIKNIKHYLDDKHQLLINILLSTTAIGCGIILIILAQTDFFGHETLSQPRAWDNMTDWGYDPRWDEP